MTEARKYKVWIYKPSSGWGVHDESRIKFVTAYTAEDAAFQALIMEENYRVTKVEAESVSETDNHQ